MRVTEEQLRRLTKQPKRQSAHYDATEQHEQEALFEFCERFELRIPELALLFHIPNGGERPIHAALALQRAGVKPGVPDLFLPVARQTAHGLFIELKTRVGKASTEQFKWSIALHEQGYYWVLSNGWEQAACVILLYLGHEPKEFGL